MTDRDVISDAITRLAAGDAAAFRDLLADDVTWTIRGSSVWSASHRGRDPVLRLLRGVGRLIDGGWRASVDRVIAGSDGNGDGEAGGGVIVVELRGNNQLRDGRRYDNQYCWLVRHAGGVIREIIEYGDTALIDRVLPPPSA